MNAFIQVDQVKMHGSRSKNRFDHIFRVAVIGEKVRERNLKYFFKSFFKGCGKTRLIKSLFGDISQSDDYEPTFIESFFLKYFTIEKKRIKVEIWYVSFVHILIIIF